MGQVRSPSVFTQRVYVDGVAIFGIQRPHKEVMRVLRCWGTAPPVAKESVHLAPTLVEGQNVT